MKKTLILVLTAVAAVASLMAEPACCRCAQAAKPKALKVLMIGNSFSVCVLREMPQVAASLGLDLDLASLYIGGCSFERHWQNVVAATNAAFKPYTFTRNIRGKVVPKTKANIPDALASDRWDIVTIQQASHLSWQPQSYLPFADNLIATIRRLAPQAEIVVQETWSYTPWDKRLKKWGISPVEMYNALHDGYNGFATARKLRMIPMGTAVQLYRIQLPVVYGPNSFGGDPCGSAKFEQDAKGSWQPKGDVFHLNAEGHYLQGLVWTAKLFGADVTQCAYRPAAIPEARAAQMKRSAMEAVFGVQAQKANATR